MSKEIFILGPNERPDWLVYPHSFYRLVEQGLVHITPWHILDVQQAKVRYRGLTERYPARKLFPFAYRQDNDDVACWAAEMGEKVLIIHDFASPGFENEGEFDDIWSWFRSAIDETIMWD